MKNKLRIAMLITSIGIFAFSGFQLFEILSNYGASDGEYASLNASYVSIRSENAVTSNSNSLPDNVSSSAPDSVIAANTADEMANYPAMPAVDWNGLLQISGNVVGWIDIPAVAISYPVMQCEDNEYYLHHTTEGNYLFAGSIFEDCENSPDLTDKNTFIYGHNMRNLSMFAKLKQFNDQDTYNSCPYFWVCTPSGNYLYQIVSVHQPSSGGKTYTLFHGENDGFDDWLAEQMSESEIGVLPVPDVNMGRIVTLSTCAGSDHSIRQVVQGILIKVINN